MKTSLKQRTGLIGVALALSALLLVVSVSATNAQGVAPQGSWGPCYYPQAGITSTMPYGYYDCGMMGWPGYGYSPQNGVPNTVPYGYGWMMGWPGYDYNPQTNVPHSTPNDYHPQNNVPNTRPNGHNSNRGSSEHGMTGGGHQSWGNHD